MPRFDTSFNFGANAPKPPAPPKPPKTPRPKASKSKSAKFFAAMHSSGGS
jgi:hypothetical protein